MLPCNMFDRKTVCNPDKLTVKCVRKSIYKFVSISSVVPGKPIRDSNVRSCKLVNTSFVRSSKPIHDSIARLSKPITSSIARPSKLVSGRMFFLSLNLFNVDIYKGTNSFIYIYICC